MAAAALLRGRAGPRGEPFPAAGRGCRGGRPAAGNAVIPDRAPATRRPRPAEPQSVSLGWGRRRQQPAKGPLLALLPPTSGRAGGAAPPAAARSALRARELLGRGGGGAAPVLWAGGGLPREGGGISPPPPPHRTRTVLSELPRNSGPGVGGRQFPVNDGDNGGAPKPHCGPGRPPLRRVAAAPARRWERRRAKPQAV